MGCGESKLAVVTADGILRRKKSISNGSKSARKVSDGSNSGADLKKVNEDAKVESEKIKSGAADSAVVDLAVASEKIDCGVKVESEKKSDEEKIDSAVKIGSENKTESREEKKIDEEKIDSAVKIESENTIEKKKSDEVKIDDAVKIESEKKTGEEEKIDGAVNVEAEKKTEHQQEKKSDGVNGGAVESQVAGETKAEEEVVANGGVVEREIKPVDENKLVSEPKVAKENGEADQLKEVPAKEEITAPKVEETQILATPTAQENNVKDVKENASDLAVKV